MTKWFDTNYHYMVPEFTRGQAFALSSLKAVDEYPRGQGARLSDPAGAARPGDVSSSSARARTPRFDPLSLLGALLPVYIDVLRRLAANGAEWVQLDEPCLVLDLDDADAATRCATPTRSIARALPTLKIMLTTYFGALGDNLDTALSLPVAGLHLDLVRAPEQLDDGAWRRRRRAWCCRSASSTAAISGAPILPALLDRLEPVVAKRGTDHVQIAPSCSLLHVPIDLELETRSRSGPEELARLRGPEDGRTCDARPSAGRQAATSVQGRARGIRRRGRRAQDVAEGA